MLDHLNKNDISQSFLPDSKQERRRSVKKVVEIKPLFDYDMTSPIPDSEENDYFNKMNEESDLRIKP